MGEKKKGKKEMEMAISGSTPLLNGYEALTLKNFFLLPRAGHTKKKSHLISVVDLSESSEASQRISESIIEKE
jgi:hypothetical protein